MPNPDPISTAEMTPWECYDFLETQHVGRICIVDDAGPFVVPMSFRILGSEAHPIVVIKTSAETKVGRYAGRAALEVDEIDEETRRARSVLARGTLHAMRGPQDLPGPQPWVTDDRDRCMILQVDEVTGRRFVARRRHDELPLNWQATDASRDNDDERGSGAKAK